MFSPQIKLICFDFDGVFTDSKIYLGSKDVKLKACNVKDMYGLEILHKRGIKTAILTDNDFEYIDHEYFSNNIQSLTHEENITNTTKLQQLITFKNKLDLNWNQIAYMGDDIDDLECLKKVGISACPADSSQEVQKICFWVSDYNGGKGAVRHFIRYLSNSGSI